MERYHRHKILGLPLEEIARQDKVTVETIRTSVLAVQMARGLANREEMELTQFSTIIELQELERKALTSALTAETEKKKPDHNVRLRASEIINEKIAALQPKGRGMPIQVGVQVNNGQPSSVDPTPVRVAARATSFEEIVRKLDAERENLVLPEQIADPPIIEADPDGVRST